MVVPGVPIAIEARVADEGTAPEDLKLSLESSLSGSLEFTGSPDSYGQFSGAVTLSSGLQTLTLTATDEDGLTGFDAVEIDVNGAPTGLEIGIVPEIPEIGEALVGAVLTDAVDPEDDRVTYVWSWEIQATPDATVVAYNPPGDPNTVPAGLTDRGQVWTVTATPSDSKGNVGEPATASVLVGNEPPSADSAVIEPDPAYTNDTLAPTVSGWMDPDGDPENYLYEWTINGTVVEGAESTNLSSSLHEKGDSVAVVVTPYDGFISGEAIAAPAIVIQNTPPSALSASIVPFSPTTTEELLVVVVGWADADGDTEQYEFRWFVDGVESPSETTVRFPAELTAHYQEVTVEITPFDGEDYGEPILTAPVTIANTAPALLAVDLSPDDPTTVDPIVATASGWSDLDDDEAGYEYSWTVNGVVAPTTGTVLSPSLTQRYDEIQCTVTPTDGDTEGASVASDVVTVVNTPPSLGSASVTPIDAVYGDTLHCSWSTFVDADSDEDLSTVSWEVDGVTVGTGLTLPSGFHGGQVVMCTVTPFDGIDSGTPVSASVLIGNTAPSIDGVSIDPDPAFAANTLNCTWEGFADVDEDSDASTVAWQINDTPAGTDTRLTSGYVDGDIVACTVTPSDGTTAGTPVTATIEIDNTAPSVELVSITPTTADYTDTLFCLWSGYHDDDGDSDFSLVQWHNGDGEILGVDDTLSGAFVGGDSITCTVTPHDDKEAGIPVTSVPVVIDNSPPTLETASLTPLDPTVEDVLNCVPGITTDPDGTTDFTYTYVWEVGGVFVPGEADSTLRGEHFARGQSVQCIVTPFDGEHSGDSVGSNIIIVRNSFPVVESASMSPTFAHTNTVLLASSTVSDADEETVFAIYAWVVNGITVLEGESAVSLNGATYFDKGDEVRLQVTPSDFESEGLPLSTESITIQNTIPSIPSVSISPPDAVYGSTLSCTWGAFLDADEDADLSTITWTVDGFPAGTGAILVEGFTGGQTVACTVTPYDGEEAGTPVGSSIVIGNTAPTITHVNISPNPAYAASTLVCAWTGFGDVDGDGDESTASWTINGISAGSGTTLSGGFVDDDLVQCTVIPSDGADTGTPVSGSREVSNTAPSIDSVNVSPASPTYADTLTCSWSGFSDDDGDDDASTQAWNNGGGDLLGTGTTLSGAFVGGDSVTCTVTPDDGKDPGSPVTSGAAVVVNSPPVLESVTAGPEDVTVEDTVTCSPNTTTDPDGTTSFTYTYGWKVNGLRLSGLTSSTLTGTHFERGDTIQCLATPSDGTDVGSEVGSNTITAQNSAPTVVSVGLSPTTATTNTVITASTSLADSDGDATFPVYSWVVNGSVVLSGTSASALNGAIYFNKGDLVKVVITPSDSIDSGASLTSDTIVVDNTPPGSPTIEILPVTPEPEDSLSCNVVSDAPDVDDDTITYTYAWYRDGTLTGFTSSTVSGSSTTHGESWECEVTAYDDEEVGGSATATIAVNDLTNPDPPVFDDLAHHTNDTVHTLTGDCEADTTVDIYCVDSTTTETVTSTCSSLGRFSDDVSLTRGDIIACAATCTDDAGNESGPSSTYSIESCSPFDTYEGTDTYGDSAADVIDEFAIISDAGDATITIRGNVLDDDDDDWFVISTTDDLSADVAAGIDYFNFNVQMTTGTADYQFVVHKGGSGAGDLECSSITGYTEYNWFVEDVGDSIDGVPSDTRSCSGSTVYGLNDCEDNSDDFYVHVSRLGASATSCEYYELSITNGVW
jgi:hypothetical protein